jgi:hypothetical protein
MTNLDYALLELKYLVDVFVAENENKVEEEDVYDVDSAISKLIDFNGSDNVLSAVLDYCDTSDLLSNMSEYDIRDYVTENCCVEDFVDWK